MTFYTLGVQRYEHNLELVEFDPNTGSYWFRGKKFTEEELAHMNLLKSIMTKEQAELARKEAIEKDFAWDRKIRQIEENRLGAGLFDLECPEAKRIF